MLTAKIFSKQIQSSPWYMPQVKILCACSGGIDSTVLFHLIHQIPELDLGIVHFDHQLRSTESSADMHFVEEMAQQNDCAFHLISEDIKTYADDHQLSIEEAGSRRRRAEFITIKNDFGFDLIATGQHQDDQIETILLNLYLGTGIQGLSGISGYQKEFIRPLLDYTRFEIEEYASQNGLDHRYDRSNADIQYLRNNIRATLIPELNKASDTDIGPYIYDLRQRSATLNEMIIQSAEHIDNNENRVDDTGKISLGLSRLPDYFSAIQKVIFDRAFQSISLIPQGLSTAHLRSLKSLLSPNAIGREFSLPAGVTAIRDRNRLTFLIKSKLEWDAVQMSLADRESFPFFQFEFCELRLNEYIADPHYFWFQHSLDEYLIRSIKAGDKMEVDGNGRELSLNQILQEGHVAPHAKSFYPVVEYQGNIIWVPGMRTAHMGMIDLNSIKENDVWHCIRVNVQEGTIE
ncbi:tRNA lysidine(34) synthetase TilS [bacterium]|nr:tRNA lysidine(34) synthetase TilS [bacterium]